MKLWVLQISDLHFGQVNPPLASNRAFPPLVDAVQREIALVNAPLVVAICGDIVDRGAHAHFDTAARSLETELLKPLGRPAVVCCPGNHDVVAGENGLFVSFNSFAFRISNMPEMAFTPTATVATSFLHGFEFVLVNSMYGGHEDREHGEVNLEHLDRATSSAGRGPRILVVHHSLIANERSDTSSLVNSYPFIQLATARGIAGILHGHLHAQNVLSFGRAGTALLGVGSLLYRPWPNYNNGFNLIRFEGSAIAEAYSFRFIADASVEGTVGTYQRTPLPLL